MRLSSIGLLAAHLALVMFVWEDPWTPTPPQEPGVQAASRSEASTQALDSLSLGQLKALADAEDSLIRVIQGDSADVDAMAELAHMYMRHGTFEQAVGPLARAIELAPGREDLWYELLLALNLAGLDRQMVDLTAKAREFADMVEMAGHSC